MMKKLWIVAGMTALLLSSTAQSEVARIGYIKQAKGTVEILRGDQGQPAAVGTAIQVNDVLKTGADGALGITLSDNTVMSLGPDTEFVVDEYLYQPAEGKLKLGSTISKGTLNYVSGIIAKLKPEAAEVKTPTGIIGLRGTRILVKVE